MAKQLSDKGPDGTSLGQSSADLIGFWGATPTAQPSGSSQAAVSTTAVTASSPYGFVTAAQASGVVVLLNEIRSALVTAGIIAGS